MNKDPDVPFSVRFAHHLRNRLVSGVLLLVPLTVTLFILKVLFRSFTGFIQPVLHHYLPGLPPYVLTVLAILSALLIVYAVGLVAGHIAGRRLIQFGESIVMKVPLIKSIYGASKQVVNTFSSSKTAFQAVVLVDFPRMGSLAVGFVTGNMLGPDGQPLYRVFIATTPNPTSGFLILFPASQVRFTDIPIEDGIKMIVSGGMLSPAQYREVDPPPLAGAQEK